MGDFKAVDAPQGNGPASTDWSLFGSSGDLTVWPQSSQLGMTNAHKVKYKGGTGCPEAPPHLDYMEYNRLVDDACYQENGVNKIGPHVVKKSYQQVQG